MSRRTPQRSTLFNEADSLERHLDEDGHRTWGFVIYRCTYGRDDEWTQFMDRLRLEIRQRLESSNGLDMMDRLQLTVVEDRSTWDGASTALVREHFKQWAATAPQQEQGTGPGLSQRYRYCVQMDAVALASILDDYDDKYEHYDDEADPATTNDGWVNLIWKDWDPLPPDPRQTVEEPIEGCTLDDVGWMRVAYQDVMVGMYGYLRDYNDWYREYRRPPEVARA
ncbi:MAG: hypothetical protein M1826_007677 [Phylliscum demangeonii]|nr:MAG: hypothetical protein M1826_007677 [Phylliscum demangeonii]